MSFLKYFYRIYQKKLCLDPNKILRIYTPDTPYDNIPSLLSRPSYMNLNKKVAN